ncbi:MAG TPA: hypothetical protein VFI22_15545, partial [Thermomicrobiales bacterium]|nr:hypothetical protein [Thermomicrobiales bacterium]
MIGLELRGHLAPPLLESRTRCIARQHRFTWRRSDHRVFDKDLQYDASFAVHAASRAPPPPPKKRLPLPLRRVVGSAIQGPPFRHVGTRGMDKPSTSPFG